MRIRLWLLACLLIFGLLPLGLTPASAQSDDAAQILARVNSLRQQNGLLPLDLSSVLTAAAQRHSDDMARTGNIDHTGSDGSSIESRVREAGYGHWRGFGIWGENIYGGQLADVDAAWNFWSNSQVHRANILKPRYREIGIGVGHSGNGTYYTLNFGSQPNVLPFFVTGSAPVVTLLLTNENDITTGEGVAVMGQATQVRIAEGTDTSKAQWQPWAPTVPFQLSDTAGQKTITVEYKDELGRGATSSRTFNVSDLGTALPTPTETVEATATVMTTPTMTTTPTPIASDTATPVATVTPQPTKTSTPSPTEPPSPTVTPIAKAMAVALTIEPTVTPALSALNASSTPSTPSTPSAPVTSPTLKPTAALVVVAANLPVYSAASRLTPPAPRAAASERPLFDFADAPGLNTFAVVIGLQAIVLVVAGIIVVKRMRRRP